MFEREIIRRIEMDSTSPVRSLTSYVSGYDSKEPVDMLMSGDYAVSIDTLFYRMIAGRLQNQEQRVWSYLKCSIRNKVGQ